MVILTLSASQLTAQQENASLYAIKAGIEANGYSNERLFYGKHRKAITHIFPKMNKEWSDTFYEQQKKIVKELGSTKFSHYSRDDGFMEFVSKLIRTKFGISKKDTWNPADIWLVNELGKMKKVLNKINNLAQFNAVLKDMFNDRQVVGISLKKMSGKVAKWELVNIKPIIKDFDDDDYVYDLSKIRFMLDVSGAGDFVNKNTTIYIADQGKEFATISIRQNSNGFSNLKFEGQSSIARSARLGEVPVVMLKSMMSDYGIGFDNKYSGYPRTLKDFIKKQDKYKRMFTVVKRKTITGIKNQSEFDENMRRTFELDAPVATSKLMQLEFIYNFLTLNDQKQSEFLTAMLFLSMKKGKNFGPFGKLY